MIVEIGHYALVLAFVLSLVQSIVPLWGAHRKDSALTAMAAPAAVMVFVLIACSFAALTTAYVTSDFSVRNVIENSHSSQPLIYKFTSVWGNHEGSMLLWILILALFGALVATARRAIPEDLRALTLAVQAMIVSAFLLFILMTSNPFERVLPAVADGRDLNPVLQDLGLAIHPPLLYVGYVGFSISFSFAAAALILGRIDAVWARIVRPWTLLAWAFLTLGIAMGSYWAYYELGWGGWWFWDPVENASLMPWLAGTALLHSTIVMEKRDALKVWTILLSILTFSLSLLGTFLVRSGILTSVHSFASDPGRGLIILIILVVFIGGALTLFALRAPLLKQGGLFAPVSREGALVVNNLLLTSACAAVFIGTLYPLALEAITGDRISVGPPFFDATFGPLMCALLLVIPFGQHMAWKRGDLQGAAQRLVFAVGLAIITTLVLIYVTKGGPVLASLAIGIGIFVIAGSIFEITTRAIGRGVGLGLAVRRAFGLPRSAWGAASAHLGVGVVIIGIAASAWSEEQLVTMREGDMTKLNHHQIELVRLSERPGPNYREDVGAFKLRRMGKEDIVFEATKRFYPVRNSSTTEAGIVSLGASQVYISLGDTQPDGAIAVRIYWKPFILLIWIGSVIMALGGMWSLTDRRLRIGLPRKAHASRLVQAAE
jgi:cytochrome c-type biogenesis protein CcmF